MTFYVRLYAVAVALAVQCSAVPTGTSLAYAKFESSIPDTAQNIRGFVPAGHRMLTSARGDLNGDGIADYAIAIISTNEDEWVPPEDGPPKRYPRFTVIAFGGLDGMLRKTYVNTGSIVFLSCQLSIKNGVLTISQSDGATRAHSYVLKFRMQRGRFELIGITRSTTSLRDDQWTKTDCNLNTGLTIYSAKDGKVREARYFPLRAPRVESLPKVDGVASQGEWIGVPIKLDAKESVIEGSDLWKGPEDLAAEVSAVFAGNKVYIKTVVTGTMKDRADMRVINSYGQPVRPVEVKSKADADCLTIEATYTRESLVVADYFQYTPVLATCSVEIASKVDNQQLVLSNSSAGRKMASELILVRSPLLPTFSEWDWTKPDA